MTVKQLERRPFTLATFWATDGHGIGFRIDQRGLGNGLSEFVAYFDNMVSRGHGTVSGAAADMHSRILAKGTSNG